MLVDSTQRRPSRHFHGLWSLWEMLRVNGELFYRRSLALDRMRMALQASAPPNKPFYKKARDKSAPNQFKSDLQDLRPVFEALGVSLSIKSLDRLLEVLSNDDCTCGEISAELAQIENRIRDELGATSLFSISEKRVQYFEQPKLFGDAVFLAFPSANNDIFEAGTCLALGRGTACVMHLMRVVEVGLKTLAGVLNIPTQNDWGSYLREIDKELEKRRKTAGKRTHDEQFYAEARVTIDGVRLAWRNQTMHVENAYSPERAEEILIAVRALMRHLSQQVAEFLV